MLEKDYLKTISERKKQSHVSKDFQHIGLVIAQTLGDEKHKALYIKLAKTVSKQILMQIAKDISQRSNVYRKGAYFMKLLKEKEIFAGIKSKKSWSKKKTKKSGQQKLKLRRRF
jgi:hypothetical protein